MTNPQTTKRAAILAIFSGIIAKMAHADQPQGTPPNIWAMPTPNYFSVQLPQAQTWTVNLDQLKDIQLRQDGQVVATITRADLIAALTA